MDYARSFVSPGLKSLLSTWKPCGLTESALADFHGLREGFIPNEARRVSISSPPGLKSLLSAWKPCGLTESALADFHGLRPDFSPPKWIMQGASYRRD